MLKTGTGTGTVKVQYLRFWYPVPRTGPNRTLNVTDTTHRHCWETKL